jgi:inner membrane protein
MTVRKTNADLPGLREAATADPAARAFLFWSRMPVAEIYPDRIVLRDQRYMDPRVGDRFSVTLRPPR